MAKLKEEHQLFIAQQLGYYRSPVQIINSVKENFDADVTKQQIYHYQKQIEKEGEVSAPTQRLKEAFLTARNQFEDNKVNVGIEFRSYRQQVLQDLLDKELAKPERLQNDNKILQILEQAAKEEGGHYTNRRDITSNGKPLATVEEIAKQVYQDLITEGGNITEIIAFVTDRYKIPESVLIN